MTRQEALEILGLTGDPGEGEVRRAHQEMVRKFHPNRFHDSDELTRKAAYDSLEQATEAMNVLIYVPTVAPGDSRKGIEKLKARSRRRQATPEKTWQPKPEKTWVPRRERERPGSGTPWMILFYLDQAFKWAGGYFGTVLGAVGIIKVLSRKKPPETVAEMSFVETAGTGCLPIAILFVLTPVVTLVTYAALSSGHSSVRQKNDDLGIAALVGLGSAIVIGLWAINKYVPKRWD